MVQNIGVRVVSAALLVLFAVVHQGAALQCWTCSSQSSPGCSDAFNLTEDRLGQIRLQECDNDRIHSSYSSFSTAVCKKQKQRMGDGQIVTLRHCDWVSEQEGQKDGSCLSSSAQTVFKIESCYTCTTHGCNGSPKNMMASIWSSILIPLGSLIVFKKV